MFLSYLFIINYKEQHVDLNKNYELFTYNFNVQPLQHQDAMHLGFVQYNDTNMNELKKNNMTKIKNFYVNQILTHNDTRYIGQIIRIFVTIDTSIKDNTIILIRDAHATKPNDSDLKLLNKFENSKKTYLIGYNTQYNISRHFNGNELQHSKGILMGYLSFKKEKNNTILNDKTWERTFGMLFFFVKNDNDEIIDVKYNNNIKTSIEKKII